MRAKLLFVSSQNLYIDYVNTSVTKRKLNVRANESAIVMKLCLLTSIRFLFNTKPQHPHAYILMCKNTHTNTQLGCKDF